MRLTRQIIASCMLTLPACVPTQQTSMTGPSGEAMLVARCSQSPSACYQAASNSCTGSYQVLDSYSKAGGIMADVIPGPVTWYYLTYQCGPSDGRTPTFPFRGPQYVPPPVYQPSVPVYRPPQTTTCNRFGNTLRCTTY